MRILFGVATVLCFSFLALCSPGATWLHTSVQAQTVPPGPKPTWHLTSTATNVATFIVDYAGTAVKDAYFLQDPACATPLTEAMLIAHARTAFTDTMTGQRMALTLNAGGVLAESVAWSHDLFSWSVHLGDFTAKAFLTPCTGQVIFAGESIWMGHGVRPYLREPLSASTLLHLPTHIPLPPALTPVTDTHLLNNTFLNSAMEAAWSKIATLNLLHDLAQQPFTVVAVLYRPATGYVEPAEELAQAEWVFIVFTVPMTRAQTQFEHYLPLVRQ